MSQIDSFPAKILLRNGGLLIVPPLAISFGLWGFLPAIYGPDQFWKGIPLWLGLLENLFRVLILAVPGLLYFGKNDAGQFLGWCLYTGGLAAYLASYLLQIIFPDSGWSQSLAGFTAPAWTTLFWLAGIGLVCVRSWLPMPWHRAIYFCAAFFFLILHVGHAGLVYFNQMR
jgi:hypothetical protein